MLFRSNKKISQIQSDMKIATFINVLGRNIDFLKLIADQIFQIKVKISEGEQPLILWEKVVMAMIKEGKKAFPNLILPFNSSLSQWVSTQNSLQFSFKNMTVFVHLPLVLNEQFHLFKVSGFPQVDKNGEYFLPVINHPVIAIAKNFFF